MPLPTKDELQKLKAKIAKLNINPSKTILFNPEDVAHVLNLNIAIVHYYIVTGKLAADWDQVSGQWLIKETAFETFLQQDFNQTHRTRDLTSSKN